MVITRIKGESYHEDLIFAIDYKDLYNEISEYDYERNEKCVIDILSLVARYKKLFARFIERDKNLEQDKEDMCREFLNDYHKGRQSDFNGYFESEVKKILLKYEKLNSNNVDNIDDVKDRLFNKFKSTPLGEMNKNMLNEIKEFLYKKIYVCSLEDYNNEFQKFVRERTAVITTDYLFPNGESRGIEIDVSYIHDLWVDVSSKNDLNYWYKNMGEYFDGVINSENNIESYEYSLSYWWDWIYEQELPVLTVLERNKGDFINNVFPLLEKELGFEIKPVEDISTVLG